MGKEVYVPYFGIQSDWEESLKPTAADGKCWVSVRNFGEEHSLHRELRRKGSEVHGEIVGSQDLSVLKDKSSGRAVTIRNETTKQECSFVATASEMNNIHKAAVIGMDVTEGGLGVSVCRDNRMKVWETDNGSVRRALEGHPIDAYHCRYFPSGMVVLSGGADCCLKIWSVETGECPVTLKGHTKSTQDACVVERGRNVISVSKDGTAKLWDCGEGKCLDTLFSCGSQINSCCLMSPPKTLELGTPVENRSEREILTDGKLLVVGCEDGKVAGISVAGRKTLFTATLPSPVNRVIQVGPTAFAAGCQGGEVAVFRLNSLANPIMMLSPVKSPILDMMVHRTSRNSEIMSFWVSKSDGTCILLNPLEQPCMKFVQLTGPQSDPIYQIRSDLNFIYTACRDGIIRKYSLKVINRLLQ